MKKQSLKQLIYRRKNITFIKNLLENLGGLLAILYLIKNIFSLIILNKNDQKDIL